MDDTSTFRRVAAGLTIGCFSIAALMGILALLGGGSFGEGEVRVLLTTLVVGCASVCMLCYLATAGTDWAPVGIGGAVVAVLPTLTSLVLIWSDWSGDDDGLLKAFGIGVVLALTFAQACLLLALAADRDNAAVVLWPTLALAVVVGFLVSAMIMGSVDAEGVWRLLGVLAILDVLGTLVTIALSRFGGRARSTAPERPAGLTVALGLAQAQALDRLAGERGVTREALVAEAIDAWLGR